MSNALQPKFKETMLAAALAGTVKAQLVHLAAYTYSPSHQFLSSVPAGARVGAPVTLTGKTFTGGVFGAANAAFSGLTSAPTIEALWIYVDTGDETTSPLVHFIDTATCLPIPAGTTGGTVTWDNGPNKIFSL